MENQFNLDNIAYDKIQIIDKNVNFWMIRTKKGVFYQEYITKQFIAIGWNILNKKIITDNNDNDLKELLQNNYSNKTPGNALNKCKNFIFQIKEKDIGIIIGDDEVAFVKIGSYYESNNSYEKEIEINK